MTSLGGILEFSISPMATRRIHLRCSNSGISLRVEFHPGDQILVSLGFSPTRSYHAG
jgi:hypothetical protein